MCQRNDLAGCYQLSTRNLNYYLLPISEKICLQPDFLLYLTSVREKYKKFVDIRYLCRAKPCISVN